ncbi:MAG: indolepyruvate oxidoreductase subunit beta [Calditrichaeota bacterium]|nr:indolepyruvate oxidoreductase subunit beta [Calditrichota bacterium]
MDKLKLKIEKDNPVINVVMGGVGGQGVLVASDILTLAALNAGMDTKKSEVHGMAQRGGSVVSQIRLGEKIYSPLVVKGSADVLLAFEKLEAVRYLEMLKQGGVVIVNDQQITPLTVYFANIPYPENVEEICRRRAGEFFAIEGIQIADDLGNTRVLNTVMLGALSTFLDIKKDDWIKAIEQRVPQKTIPLNIKAFEEGAKIFDAVNY